MGGHAGEYVTDKISFGINRETGKTWSVSEKNIIQNMMIYLQQKYDAGFSAKF